MPNCSKCNKSQARLKNDGDLCGMCFNEVNNGQVKRKEVTDNGSINPLNNDITDDLFESLKINPKQRANDITIEQQLSLFQHILRPMEKSIIDINTKLENVSKEFKTQVTSLDKRIKFLEAENCKKDEDNAILKTTVKNLQKSLSSIDAKERANNVIIAGLSEESMQVNNENLTNDSDKVKYILKSIKLNENIACCPLNISRIGSDNNNEKKRFLKVTFDNNKLREDVIKNSHNLKELAPPLNKVFINRDTHPVYLKEHQRLRKRFNDEKKRHLDKGADYVKLTKGTLYINGEEVDKNIFLN